MTALKYWQEADIILQVPLQLPHACDVAGYFHAIHLALHLSLTNIIQTFHYIYVRMQSQIHNADSIQTNERYDLT